ncbi:MAG TPA: HD domain-containing protein [Candidatus Portnoybacteria bacterium]|nr:HD domain-containing protein [Candidatus Portnoybacteria bacterium]
MFTLHLPINENQKLSQVIEQLKKTNVDRYWRSSNVNSIDRLGMNDHGPTHVKIVANSALRILRILAQKNIIPSVVKNYQLKHEDAEVIVVLGALLHDIGMVIHRQNHEFLSTILAQQIIEKAVNNVYNSDEQEIIKFEVLHTIYCHEPNTVPFTIEGGVVKVADALDMEQGRARIPFKFGKVTIHSVSAMAIKQVIITEDEDRPLKITIKMSNPAGIFQVDELLRDKIQTSGIEKLIKVKAVLDKNGQEEVLKTYKLD